MGTVLCGNSFHKGVAAFEKGEFATAEEYFKKANTLTPNEPAILFNLAQCYLKNNNNQDALELLLQVIARDPIYSKAYILLIELYTQQDNSTQAESLCEKLATYRLNNTQAHLILARYYKNKEQFDRAIAHYRNALNLEPHNKNISFELAIVYTLIGQTKEAISLYDDILQSHPTNVTVLYNKGYTLKMQGNCDAAIECYKKALNLNQDYNEAHFALGMAYINKGDFKQGWEQHTRFLKQVGRNGDTLRTYLKQGTTNNKTILLKPEGGLGDSINFVRYAKTLKKYGFKVIVAVPEALYKLFKNTPGIDMLLKIGDSVPHIDDHTTLMSIPAILYDYEQQLPPFEPYIFPDQKLAQSWGEKLSHDPRFKIGICWEASVYNDSSRPPVARRGMPLKNLYVLSEIEHISLYSLQQKDGLEQLQYIPPHLHIHTFDDTFDIAHGSFMDTAAVIQHLDLVISVDTAIAHLAGAMGKPVWLLLPWATDWRWLAHHTTSPWYPTMRIFKQPKPFDWESVANDVFWALLETVASHNNNRSINMTLTSITS